MFGASLISREFNSWSTRPKSESELWQDALQINQRDQLHLVCCDCTLSNRIGAGNGNTVRTDILVYVPVRMVVDHNVECVGVAVSVMDEVFNPSLSTIVHLYNVTLSLLLRHTGVCV